MLKAVFRPEELVTLTDKVVIENPSAYQDTPGLGQVDDLTEDIDAVEEYTGPTADDLRREAEMFKVQWEEEKERMISSANTQAENIITDAQNAAFQEVKRKTDEAQIIKQQAEEEAERIIADANLKAADIENEVRQTLENERREAREKGREEGKEEGFASGKAEVDDLVKRTQQILYRAYAMRETVLKETEQEVVDLVLLITRKVIKIISEHQKGVIVSNVKEALRKVRSKGTIIIKVNIADLKLATEHRQDFINMMEGAQSIEIVEDGSIDRGGCIIETDFGEIDARISSQLAELESRILEVSPIRSSIKDNLPPPVVRTANLNADLAASSAMIEAASHEHEHEHEHEDEDERELSPEANAALTASAALAALTTMATKGKRETDKKMMANIETFRKRNTD